MKLCVLLWACLVPAALSGAATFTVDNDGPADFATIQAAIEAASDGDVIVVKAGRYAGEGNKNLTFSDKAITLRSLNPNDPNCLQATIIDAEGEGLIARFFHDETAETIFEGFTLVAGDTTTVVRGVPGFFEFSAGARPTIRLVRVEPAASDEPTTAPFSLSAMGTSVTGPPYGGRVWDANNPFHQPAPTTDYYGSGDADNDGALTAADVDLAQEMADGLKDPCIRADVDGDGQVNAEDVRLIDRALKGDPLPAHWNSLATRHQRNEWVTKVLAIDITDRQPWYYWFQCLSFALQFHIHGAFYRGDLTQTNYTGGPTVFNLPVYHVSISATAFGHSVNGILVGDDPLNFDDWRFLEPQNDNDILPGMWDMPYGSSVRISAPNFILSGAGSAGDKVKFYVDEGGWVLQDYRPDFIVTRPSPDPVEPNNAEDLWNPRFVPGEPNMTLLFERCRRDLSRTTDMHLAISPSLGELDGRALTMSPQYSRLLDVRREPRGAIHLLWTGKPDHIPGVFHGILDMGTRRLTNTTRVSSGTRMIRGGRVVVTSSGELHVFWLEYKSNTSHPHDSGIYWTRWTGTQWQAAENIAHHAEAFIDSSNWVRRDFLRYYFDVEPFGDNGLILIMAEPVGYTHDSTITSLLYDGRWAEPQAIETINARGVEILTDSGATVHMLYWLADRTTSGGWGALLHRTSADGYSWSQPRSIEPGIKASCPRMAAGADSGIYLVFEKEADGNISPVLKTLQNGNWDTVREFTVRPGADAWYPTVEVLKDGRPLVAWSARSADRVTIETWAQPLKCDFDASGCIDMLDLAIFAKAWLTGPRDRDWNPQCDLAIPPDDFINSADYAVFANNWLACSP